MSRTPRKRHVQLTLDQARKPSGTHGGWRPNAGRPRTRAGVSHDVRQPVSATHPQHVTLRIVAGVSSLRRSKLVELIRDAIAQAHGPEFRVAHFVVESNHLHMIVEASSNEARARGLKGMNVRVARRVNRALDRSGPLFADRYHARALTTPREVHNAIRYVLNNTRHHVPELENDPTWFDPCSSAAWFDGWAQPIEADTPWKRELLERPAPTARPRTWLLSVGWRRHGPLRFDEVPGRSRGRRVFSRR